MVGMDEKTKALVERLINAATMHRKHPCEVYDMVALANEAAATIRAQSEENERLTKLILSEPAGHDKPCYYCGELTSSIAGNSARWPVPLCHKEEPGKVAWHHIGCVMKKLREGEAAEAKLAAIQSAEGCDIEGAKHAYALELGKGFSTHDIALSAALAVGCAPLRAKIEKMEAVVKAACEYEAYPSERALDELETRVIEYTRHAAPKEPANG